MHAHRTAHGQRPTKLTLLVGRRRGGPSATIASGLLQLEDDLVTEVFAKCQLPTDHADPRDMSSDKGFLNEEDCT